MALVVRYSRPEGVLICGDTREHKEQIKKLYPRFRASGRLPDDCYWYWPRTRDRRLGRSRIEDIADQLRKQGVADVTVDYTDPEVLDVEAREQRLRDQQAAREERLEEREDKARAKLGAAMEARESARKALPWGGEPIKVGHHSEGRHRRAIERGHTTMRKSIEASDKVARASGRVAGTQARAAEREAPGVIRRRIERLQEDLRRAERAGAKGNAADLKAEIAYYQKQLDETGARTFGPADFRKGEKWQYDEFTVYVKRVNPKSVTFDPRDVRRDFAVLDIWKVPYTKMVEKRTARGDAVMRKLEKASKPPASKKAPQKNWIVEMTINSRVRPVQVKAPTREAAKDAAERKHPEAERIWSAFTLSEWRKLGDEQTKAKKAPQKKASKPMRTTKPGDEQLPPGVTRINLTSLARHMKGARRATAVVRGTSRPHIRRTVKAGLAELDVQAEEIALTPLGVQTLRAHGFQVQEAAKPKERPESKKQAKKTPKPKKLGKRRTKVLSEFKNDRKVYYGNFDKLTYKELRDLGLIADDGRGYFGITEKGREALRTGTIPTTVGMPVAQRESLEQQIRWDLKEAETRAKRVQRLSGPLAHTVRNIKARLEDVASRDPQELRAMAKQMRETRKAIEKEVWESYRTLTGEQADQVVMKTLQRMDTPIGLREPEIAAAANMREDVVWETVQRLAKKGAVVQTTSKGWKIPGGGRPWKLKVRASSSKPYRVYGDYATGEEVQLAKQRLPHGTQVIIWHNGVEMEQGTVSHRQERPKKEAFPIPREPKPRRHEKTASASDVPNCPYAVFEFLAEQRASYDDTLASEEIDALRHKELLKIPKSWLAKDVRTEDLLGRDNLVGLVKRGAKAEANRRISDERLLRIFVARRYAPVVRAFRKAHSAGRALTRGKKTTPTKMKRWQDADAAYQLSLHKFAGEFVDDQESSGRYKELIELADKCAIEIGTRAPAARAKRHKEVLAMRQQLMDIPMLPGMAKAKPKAPTSKSKPKPPARADWNKGEGRWLDHHTRDWGKYGWENTDIGGPYARWVRGDRTIEFRARTDGTDVYIDGRPYSKGRQKRTYGDIVDAIAAVLPLVESPRVTEMEDLSQFRAQTRDGVTFVSEGEENIYWRDAYGRDFFAKPRNEREFNRYRKWLGQPEKKVPRKTRKAKPKKAEPSKLPSPDAIRAIVDGVAEGLPYAHYAPDLKAIASQGLIEWSGGLWRLTARGKEFHQLVQGVPKAKAQGVKETFLIEGCTKKDGWTQKKRTGTYKTLEAAKKRTAKYVAQWRIVRYLDGERDKVVARGGEKRAPTKKAPAKKKKRASSKAKDCPPPTPRGCAKMLGKRGGKASAAAAKRRKQKRAGKKLGLSIEEQKRRLNNALRGAT